jgi:hypothetical protein
MFLEVSSFSGVVALRASHASRRVTGDRAVTLAAARQIANLPSEALLDSGATIERGESHGGDLQR